MRYCVVASCNRSLVRGLHSSSVVFKREEKIQDKKLRIHLFDFDEIKAPARPELTFKPLADSVLAPTTPSGYRPAASTKVDGLPFFVHRSKSEMLPVYTEFKNKKARPSTVIRRVSGNLDAFEGELRKVVGDAAIKRRLGGFEVFGNTEVYTPQIKDWLLHLGF